MPLNESIAPYTVFLTPRANTDLQRLGDYLETLATYSARSRALEQVQSHLSQAWMQHPFYDRQLGLRVYYVSNWYSFFYTSDETEQSVFIIAILAQSEDIARLAR